MSRLFTLVKKNLLRFFRNPKTVGFLVLMPVVYYSLIGLIFGNTDFGNSTSTYNIGWIDLDNSKADYSIHSNFNLTFIYQVIEGMDGIDLVNYSSEDLAKEAAIEGSIISYVVFPQGFESFLENSSSIKIGFWINDTSTSQNYSLTSFYNFVASMLYPTFRFTFIPNSTIANEILNNFDNFPYDGVLIFNQNFSRGLDNGWNINMSFFYRKGFSKTKNLYVIDVLENQANNYFHSLGSNCSITIPQKYNREIENSSEIIPTKFEIYFVQSISPITHATIENVLANAISQVINSNPVEVPIEYDVKSTSVRIVNNITYSSPGYVLYGPLTILSYALIILTSEKKNGIFKRLDPTGVKNHEIILSNIISNILLIFIQFFIGVIILSLFGWNPIIYSSIDAILGIILTLLVFSFFVLSIAFALAPIFKDPETAAGGVWIIIIPLAMLSGVFVPVEVFGDVMQKIVSFLPLRFAVLVLQNLLLKGLPLTYPETIESLLSLLVVSTVILLIGIKFFNKFRRN